MAKRAAEGDLIAIPAPEGWALAKVLFVSAYFKNIMLIGVFGTSFGRLEEIPADFGNLEFQKTFYTAAVGYEKRGWKRVGQCELSIEESEASLRIVGGEVWLRDEELRPASNQDEETIRTMGVDGFIRVENQIARMFG